MCARTSEVQITATFSTVGCYSVFMNLHISRSQIVITKRVEIECDRLYSVMLQILLYWAKTCKLYCQENTGALLVTSSKVAVEVRVVAEKTKFICLCFVNRTQDEISP